MGNGETVASVDVLRAKLHSSDVLNPNEGPHKRKVLLTMGGLVGLGEKPEPRASIQSAGDNRCDLRLLPPQSILYTGVIRLAFRLISILYLSFSGSLVTFPFNAVDQKKVLYTPTRAHAGKILFHPTDRTLLAITEVLKCFCGEACLFP